MKSYAGIGSRETPKHIQLVMAELAYYLAKQGWMLNSGGADGADLAFQIGCEKFCKEHKKSFAEYQQIFLPWDGFNSLKVREDNGCYVYKKDTVPIDLIKELHPSPNSILAKSSVTALMSRNAYQVLGMDLKTPVKMIICYSSQTIFDDKGLIKDVAGGTGQAVRIAYKYHIPVFNLAISEHLLRIENMLKCKK